MDDGMWRVVRPLHPSHRLVELVEARLAGLSGQERRLLELVSFGEPLGQAELETFGYLAIAERLETAGLLRVRFSHGRIEVRLSHPVYGDVLRAGLSEERVAAMARALAEAVESKGVHRTDELLRIGGWRLAGGGGSPGLMVAAAVEARWRYDFALAERLVSAAQERGAGFDADLLAAKLLGIQGRSERAEGRPRAVGQHRDRRQAAGPGHHRANGQLPLREPIHRQACRSPPRPSGRWPTRAVATRLPPGERP